MLIHMLLATRGSEEQSRGISQQSKTPPCIRLHHDFVYFSKLGIICYTNLCYKAFLCFYFQLYVSLNHKLPSSGDMQKVVENLYTSN
jgi:hypothetical protein